MVKISRFAADHHLGISGQDKVKLIGSPGSDAKTGGIAFVQTLEFLKFGELDIGDLRQYLICGGKVRFERIFALLYKHRKTLLRLLH